MLKQLFYKIARNVAIYLPDKNMPHWLNSGDIPQDWAGLLINPLMAKQTLLLKPFVLKKGSQRWPCMKEVPKLYF